DHWALRRVGARGAHICQTEIGPLGPLDRAHYRVVVKGTGAGDALPGSKPESGRTTSVPMDTDTAMDKVDKVESTIGKGIVAGFVATFVLSALLDPFGLFAPSILPASPPVGWVLHFFVGTVVWGIGFAVLHDYLRGPAWQRGLMFALGAWIVVITGAAILILAGV